MTEKPWRLCARGFVLGRKGCYCEAMSPSRRGIVCQTFVHKGGRAPLGGQDTGIRSGCRDL